MEWQKPLTCFPDRLSPVFVRDLRQTLRSPLVVTSILILQVAVLGLTGIELFLVWLTDGDEAGGFISWAMSAFLSIGFGLALPLTAIGALQPELGNGRNIELLTITSLSRWQVVRGKWFTVTALSALLLCSITPYLIVRYFLGSVDLTAAGLLFASALMTNGVMNAVVIGASGFRHYVARGLTIVFFGLIYLVSSSMSVASMSGIDSSGSALLYLSWLNVPLSAATIGILALQLGRARLKLFSTIHRPPATGGILGMALALPFLQGISWSAGGAWAFLILTVLWLAVAFLIDRPQRPPYR